MTTAAAIHPTATTTDTTRITVATDPHGYGVTLTAHRGGRAVLTIEYRARDKPGSYIWELGRGGSRHQVCEGLCGTGVTLCTLAAGLEATIRRQVHTRRGRATILARVDFAEIDDVLSSR